MKKAAREAAILALFALPYFYFTWPVVASPHDTLVWGQFLSGHLWNLQTAMEGLLGDHSLLCTREIRFPYGGSMFFIGWAIIFLLSFFKLLGLKLVLSLNIIFFMSYLFACYAAYRLALRLVSSRRAAVLAGLSFGYAPFFLTVYFNGQVAKLSHGFFPLLVILLLEIERGKKVWPMLLFGPAIVLLLSTSPYYGVFAAILAVALGLFFLGRADAKQRWKVFLRLGVAAIITSVFAAYFLSLWHASMNYPGHEQVFDPGMTIFPPYAPWDFESATLLGWLKPNPYATGPGGQLGVYMMHSLGWAIVLLAAAAFLPRRKKNRNKQNLAPLPETRPPLSRWVLLMLLFVFMIVACGFTLRPSLEQSLAFSRRVYLPSYWLAYFFGSQFSFGGMTHRAVAVMALCVSLLAAIGWQRLESFLPKGSKTMAAALVGLVLLAEPIFALPISFPLPTKRYHVPQVYYDLAEIKDDGAVLEAPYDSFQTRRFMLNLEHFPFQKVHRHPIILSDRRLMSYRQFPRFGDELDVLIEIGKLNEPLEAGSYLLGFRYLVLHENLIDLDRLAEVKKYLEAMLEFVRHYPNDHISLYRTPLLPPGFDPARTPLDRRYYLNPDLPPSTCE